MRTTAEGMMTWGARIVIASIVIAAICFVAGAGWVFWQIAQYVGLL